MKSKSEISAPYVMRTHYLKIWIQSHYILFLGLLMLLIYFLWMDALLHFEIQKIYSFGLVPANDTPVHSFHSAFQGITIKLIMTDHMNNYVYLPLTYVFVKELQTWPIYNCVTPNTVSFIGMLVGFVSAKYVSYDNLIVQRIAVIIFGVRNWLDCVDGVVARFKKGVVKHSSQLHTSGYIVDGGADTIATVAFLIGLYFYFRSSKQHAYLPVHSNGNRKNNNETRLHTFQRSHFFPVLLFGFQIGLSCILWNRYILSYGEILDSPRPTKAEQILQADIMKSSATWIIMWCWRILNSHAIIEMLLFAIFINKSWEFLVRVKYIGYLIIGSLGLCSEIYLQMIRSQLSAY